MNQGESAPATVRRLVALWVMGAAVVALAVLLGWYYLNPVFLATLTRKYLRGGTHLLQWRRTRSN